MKYAIIDTETSGLFDFSKPADAEGQPRLAHFAAILTHDLVEVHTVEMFVKPDGWSMPDDVAAINGLTNEILADKGVPIAVALGCYTQLVNEGHVIVAFNSQYDTKVMRGELRRAGMDDLFDRTPNICVMRALTDICRIPKARGGGFKFPKLSQAAAHFDLQQDAAHRAMGDARTAFDLFRKLHELGACPPPCVHLAKIRPQE